MRGSHRRRTAGGPRTGSRGRSSWSTAASRARTRSRSRPRTRALRFWRNTSVASLGAGATKTMPAGSLGYEWDADLDNGARPAGLIRLSSATYNLSGDLLLDNGSTFGNGPATHNLTLYRAASGALVFGAGTVQWAWGLDANHDRAGMAVDQDMRQATVNLFADMGAQPGTLQSGLVAATASTDTTAPAATVTASRRRLERQHGSIRDRVRDRLRTRAAAWWPASRSPPTAAPVGIPRQGRDRGRTRGRRNPRAPRRCSPARPTTAPTSALARRRSR